VKIKVRDVEAAVKELRCEEPTQELTQLLASPAPDFRMPAAVSVQLSYYRGGSDLFFQGRIEGEVTGRCARCLEEYAFTLATDFALVCSPHREGRGRAVEEEDDADLTYYEGDEIDLSPLLREQILLALPTRPLCREDCAGLCPHCGVNRTTTSCECQADRGDPRLAVLRTLKVHG